ncbi:MAG: Tat proofreading chaperone DmsD [Coriobacteriales bacterium]|nr:Tat proofreading chaperone DmsD [Coriobacteriales bacterium]
MAEHTQDELAAVGFVGSALAPFFLEDPRTGSAGEAYAAISAMNAQEAAEQWPFVESEEALKDIKLMQTGLADGGASGDPVTWEYRRLFIGPARKPCPPWGSVYMDHEMVVFGETTLELRSWMRQNHIRRECDEKTPEDHIGLMLALMSFIAENRPELLDEFLQTYLFTWSTHYLDELEEFSEQSFFTGLARLTRATLEGIQKAFGIKVTYPKYYR